MKRSLRLCNAIASGLMLVLFAQSSSAIEVITKDDLVNNVVKKEQLVRVADNAIFLLDTSSSMNDKFAGTDTPKVQVMKRELEERNSWFPDLGHQVGIYTYTDWQENYPVQAYNREKVAAALAGVRDTGKGPTALNSGLGKLEPILDSLQGRTAVFLFSDGEYTGPNPANRLRQLAKADDVCFYIISTATPKREAELRKDVESLNACSRLIPLADFVSRPEYTTGALFDVKVTEQVETTMQKKLVGMEIKDINFATNKSELAAEDKAQLDKLGAFMKDRTDAYALIAGYTDDVGTRDHNEGLSRQRAEMVARYLKETYGIDDSRMVLFWYGPNNPLVANDSPENQAKNRRVEVRVGLRESA
jgi:OOP family OmpA-OmpF porin